MHTTQSKSNDAESTRMFGNNETVTQGGDNSSIHKTRTLDVQNVDFSKKTKME